jgi:pantoate--beta-alanine ligase
MERFDTVRGIRDYVSRERSRGQSVAFVPTMGALHDGHRACIEVAGEIGDAVVASIFVNPTQFGPGEDLSRYPRPLDEDLSMCENWGVDAVFVPEAGEIYPAPQTVWVEVENLSVPLCGRSRPGHFRGVATVVLKLFNIVRPDSAVFGQKDAQQALVIREMTRQLDLPVAITLSPTVRESDGVAMSSRNRYLSATERSLATGIYRSLQHGRETIERGETEPVRVAGDVRRRLEIEGIRDIEYVELLSAGDLSLPARAKGKVLIAVAVRVGTTRLIDNLCLDVREDGKVDEALLF